jgi:hypothetical protein
VSPEARSLFDNYTAIARALYATRSGHEDGHLEYLKGVLKWDKNRLFHVDIRELESEKSHFCRHRAPDIVALKEVSMSWWISQPVQSYLDHQVCLVANNNQIERALKVSNSRQETQAGTDTCPYADQR